MALRAAEASPAHPLRWGRPEGLPCERGPAILGSAHLGRRLLPLGIAGCTGGVPHGQGLLCCVPPPGPPGTPLHLTPPGRRQQPRSAPRLSDRLSLWMRPSPGGSSLGARPPAPRKVLGRGKRLPTRPPCLLIAWASVNSLSPNLAPPQADAFTSTIPRLPPPCTWPPSPPDRTSKVPPPCAPLPPAPGLSTHLGLRIRNTPSVRTIREPEPEKLTSGCPCGFAPSFPHAGPSAPACPSSAVPS